MLNFKINKEKNKIVKFSFSVLFSLFIVFNSIWYIKDMVVWSDPIGILLYSLIPLILGILGSWKIFNKFKDKESLKFCLGTIFSAVMYYVFWYLGIFIMSLIAVISIVFE